jgi:PhnB protein
MHSMLEAENGITFMAADTPNGMEYRAGTNMSMSLSGDNEADADSLLRQAFGGWHDTGAI